MTTFNYFAYGSNMLAERLKERCNSARAIGPAWVEGYQLAFDKRSTDGSGKATLIKAEDRSARVYGVIFSILTNEKPDLDRAEGAGYACITDFKVFAAPTSPVEVVTYLAVPKPNDIALVPYDWYRDLVIAGARQNALPDDYVKGVEAKRAKPDPILDRPERLDALALLGRVGRPT